MYDLAQFSQGRTPFYSGFRPKVGQFCCSKKLRFRRSGAIAALMAFPSLVVAWK
jgi:hypothetical protein